MKILLITTILLLFTTLPVRATDEDKHCNKRLLGQFKLSGRTKPKQNDFMDVCGVTIDNCCTILDEMMIIKYWNEFSKSQIVSQANQTMHMYKSIFTLHNIFASLEINTIPAHHIYERWVPFFKTTCSTIYQDNFDDDMDNLGNLARKGHGDKYFRELKKNQEDLDKNGNKIQQDMEIINKGEKGFENSIKQNLENYFYSNSLDLDASKPENKDPERKLQQIGEINSVGINDQNNDSEPAVARELKDVTHKLPINEEQIKALTNMEKIKDAFKQTVDRSVSKIHKLFDRKMKQAYSVKKKVELQLAYLDHMLEESKKNPKYLNQIARKLDQKVSTNDEFNEKLLKNLYKNKKTTEDARQYLQQKRTDMAAFVDKLDSFIKRGTEKEKSYLAAHITIPLDNEYMSKLINTIITHEFPIKRKLAAAIPKPRALPRFPNPSLPINICKTQPQLFYRKFYILNEEKLRYCDDIYIYIKSFDLKSFIVYMNEVRTAYLRIAFVKKSIYCAVCDYNKQKFFDMDKEIIYFNEGTCENLLHRFKKYFEWKNIIFIEYIYNIMQYIECFDTPGNSIDYPFKTMIDKYEKQIFFIKRCLKNFEGPRILEYCHFFCKQYKYHRISELIEGDVKLLKSIYMKMVSFLRKQNIELPRDYQEELKNNFGKFYDLPYDHHDETTSEDIEHMIANDAHSRKLRAELVEAVYVTRLKETPLDRYKTVFIDDDGLQPFDIDQSTRFDIDMEERVGKYIRKIGGKQLKKDIIKDALIPNNNLQDFNEDINLPFFDRDLDFLEPKMEAPQEKIDVVYDKLNKKESDTPITPGTKIDVLTEKIREDGLPELEYVFSNA